MSEGMDESNEELHKKKDKDKDRSRKDKKDVKGYIMFGEDESGDELVAESSKSFKKLKKPKSFKFSKKEKEDKKEKKEKTENEKKEKSEKKSKSEKEKLEKKIKKEEKKLFKKNRKVKGSKKILHKAGGVVSGSIKVVDDHETEIFGMPLAVAVERNPCHDGIPLPAIVRECIDYVSEYGIACEGIYRVSGVKSKVHHLKDLYNHGKNVYLVDHEPNTVSSLLKLFLRELPEPILTHKLFAKFEAASTLKDAFQQQQLFTDLINELPPANQALLSWVILHMTDVIRKEKLNKMSLQNVSIVLSPTMKISHRVLNVLFTFSQHLFKDTIIKRYVPPMRPASSKWTLYLPESRDGLEEELEKQESLLDHIHEGLSKNKHPGLEERLWEVQRVVTQLKRKLKHLKQLETTNSQEDTQTSTSISSVLDKKYPPQQLKLIKTLHNSPQVLKRLNDKFHNDGKLEDRLSDMLDHISLSSADHHSASHHKHGSFKQQRSNTRHSLGRKGSDASRKQVSETKRHSSNVSDKSLKIDSKRSSRLRVDCDRTSKTSLAKKESFAGKGSEVLVLEGGIDSVENDMVEGVVEKDVVKEVSEDDVENKDPLVRMIGKDSVDNVVVIGIEKDTVDVTVRGANGTMEDGVVEAKAGLSAAPKSQGDVAVVNKRGSREMISRKRLSRDSENCLEEGSVELFKVKEADVDAISEISQAETLPYEKLDDEEEEEEEEEDDDSSQPYTIGDVDSNDRLAAGGGEDEDDVDDEIQSTLCHEWQKMKIEKVVCDDDDEYRKLGDESMSSIPDLSNIDSSSASSASSSSSPVDDSYVHFERLFNEYNYLLMEEEELIAIGDEMRQKIATEVNEIERMQQDISELHLMRRNDDSSISSSSSSSSSSLSSPSFEDDGLPTEDKSQALEKLVVENKTLEEANAELSKKIYQERVACLEVKLQIRIIQQKNKTTSYYANRTNCDDVVYGGGALQNSVTKKDAVASIDSDVNIDEVFKDRGVNSAGGGKKNDDECVQKLEGGNFSHNSGDFGMDFNFEGGLAEQKGFIDALNNNNVDLINISDDGDEDEEDGMGNNTDKVRLNNVNNNRIDNNNLCNSINNMNNNNLGDTMLVDRVSDDRSGDLINID